MNESSFIDLASSPSFRLGDLLVTPSTRQVTGVGKAETIAEPRVLQVLIALVDANGAVVSRDALIKRCWDGRIVSEDAINRSIAKVRRLADLTDPQAFSVETIPRIGYRLRIAGGAVSETSPDVSERVAASIGAVQPVLGDTKFGSRARTVLLRRPLLWSIPFASVLLLGGWVTFGTLHPKTAGERRIAVEPLHIRSADAPAEAVRLGLAGDLARALTVNPGRLTINEVVTPSPTTPADLVLTGDAATIDGRLQAHVQLASRRSGGILWAADFVGDPGHPDVLTDQIATKADAVFSCGLNQRHLGHAVVDDESARLYLKACDLIEQFRVDDALVPFQQLTALKPGYALAWADLATTQAMVATLNPERQTTAFGEATTNAKRALSIDSTTGLAYYALANTTPGVGAWRRRVDTINRGLAVEPDGSELNNAMASELMSVGRIDEALTFFRRSMAADPLNPVKTATLFRALAEAGHMDEADTLIHRALRLWRRNYVVWTWAFAVELRFGDPNMVEAMLNDADRPAMLDPKDDAAARGWLRARREPAHATAEEAMALVPNEVQSGHAQDVLPAAVHLAEIGRTDLAYALLLRAGANAPQEESNDGLLFEHALTSFRADPRFRALVERRGIVQIWRSTGRWPDFCSGRFSPDDCQTLFAGG